MKEGQKKPRPEGRGVVTTMQRPLRDIVRERLDALNRSPFEAARIAGLHRSYLNDIVIGRKESVRDITIPRVARALDWTPQELYEAKKVNGQARHDVQEHDEPNMPEPGIAHTLDKNSALLEDWTVFFWEATRHDPVSTSTADLIRNQVKIVLPIFEAHQQYERLRREFYSGQIHRQAENRTSQKERIFDTARKPSI